jgi:hypothetical protein
MRLILCATMTVLLTAPAYAQTMNMLSGPKTMKTDVEVKQEEERTRAYQDAMKKLPDQNVKRDPWGAVRGADAPQANQKKAKSDPK